MARKGLPKSIIKKYGITKKAWQVYRRGKTKSKQSNPSKPKTTRRRSNPMARRKRRSGRRNINLPIALLVGAGAGLAIKPDIQAKTPIQNLLDGKPDRMVVGLARNYLGLNLDNGTWDITKATGLLALGVGVVVHKVMSRLGVNRALGRAGVPLLRI